VIRLLALDLDGTLMGDDLQVSPRVRAALAAARQHRVIVTLATGRMFQVAAHFARDLEIGAPLICYQGALVQAPDAPAPLYLATMERKLMGEIVELQTRRGWSVVLYSAGQAFVARRAYPSLFHDILARESLTWVDSLGGVIEQHEPVKFIAIAEPAEADGIEAELEQRFNGRLEVVRSHAIVVEGYPLGVSKGDALARLAAHLGVTQVQVMAIGDQDNDASMIAWAGVGVAMGNASPSSRAVADWIAPTVGQDGVAVAIEHFILNNGGGT
jgi:hypothetical protein